MSTPTPRQLTLHAIRCAGMPSTEKVLSRVDEDEATVRSALAQLEADEVVRHREKPMDMWQLLAGGREEHASWLQQEVAERGCHDEVQAQYDRFLVLNEQMLQLCNDWQLRDDDGEQVPNDHTDPDHDAAVLARLVALDDEVQPILVELEKVLPWMGRHAPALAAALERLQGGEHEWLTSIRIDSYHTIWFEFHEELLATLGITREQESDALAARG